MLTHGAFSMLLDDCCRAAHRADRMNRMCARFRTDAMLGKNWNRIDVAKRNTIARKLVALEKLTKEGHAWNDVSSFVHSILSSFTS